MKCIQSIKQTKNIELGTIKRVDEKDADSSVKSGYWKYIPKSEWKLTTRKSKQTKVENQITDSVTIEKKEKKNKK